MPRKQKRHKKYKSKKSPLLLLILAAIAGASLILVVSVKIFKNTSQKEPEVIITDGQFKANQKIAFFLGKKIPAPTEPWLGPIQQQVLSAENDDQKWVEVDLTNQKVRAWNGDHLDYEFPTSTGKKQWGTATPTGSYRIWIKLRSTLMHGGSGDTYYYLPNVQCTQYFHNGFGLHGTYWHNNFGHPMSHGCVNMRTEDACTLFYWTSPPIDPSQTMARPTQENMGTRVVVVGETPLE